MENLYNLFVEFYNSDKRTKESRKLKNDFINECGRAEYRKLKLEKLETILADAESMKALKEFDPLQDDKSFKTLKPIKEKLAVTWSTFGDVARAACPSNALLAIWLKR